MDDGSRDADGAASKSDDRPRIQKLEETVINRIAAGEVVVRPANALKELMENSIDAGSTRILVSVKSGGLKMLRIEDDGHGINFKDLPILCERFTTSKLKKYEDLGCIGTFGFRGEALASISHVAHVTVSTMTAEDKLAHTCQYTDGVLRGPPRPCAGTRGTTIVAEDMFYNNPTRRAALGKESIEYTRILEVIQKYSIHYPRVAFSCRKAGSASVELQTLGGPEVTPLQAVGVVYGHNISKELFSFAFKSEDPKFSCEGLATGPNWTSKSGYLTLFINHRLVECPMLKRAVDAVYMPVLPKHQHPWVYLALEVDPATIDVNVHPTKSEVQFLHEELIAQRLQEALAAELKSRGGSRTYDTKIPIFGADAGKVKEPKPDTAATQPAPQGSQEQRQPYLNPMRIRTDHLQQSLQSLFRSQTTRSLETMDVEQEVGETQALASAATQKPPEVSSGRLAAFAEAQRLTSVCELKAACSLAADAELTKRLGQSVFVGPATRELALLQSGPALCLVNMQLLLRECAYQRLLRKFGGPGCITLKTPLPLQELVKLGIQDPRSGYDPSVHVTLEVDEVAAQLTGLLASKAEMLNEYFMLQIDKGQLLSLPNALGLESDVGLSLAGLPLFLIRLSAETDWSEEKACFRSLCQIIAEFAADAALPDEEEAEQELDTSPAATAASLNAAVEAGEYEDIASAAIARAAKRQRKGGAGNALEPLRWAHEALRRDGQCLWPASFLRDGTVLELVSLDQLYRIFERC